MRLKDSCKYKNDVHDNLSPDAYMELQRETMRKVRFTGITSLDLDGYPFRHRNFQDRVYQNIYIISFILPNLREVNFSYMPVTGLNLFNFSMNCPLLEKVTLNNDDIFENNNNAFAAIRLDGSDMRHSNSLKEIYLDSSRFECGLYRNAIEDLNDQPEVYICSIIVAKLSNVFRFATPNFATKTIRLFHKIHFFFFLLFVLVVVFFVVDLFICTIIFKYITSYHDLCIT